MWLAAIELMQDASEVVRYERDRVRLYIRRGSLSLYPDLCAPCHWHEDIECIRVLDGTMGYFIDGERVRLRTGDTLVVNSRRMHYGFSDGGGDCAFLCVLFHPDLLTGNPLLRKEELLPIVKNPGILYWQGEAGTEFGEGAADCLDRIAALKDASRSGYEWEAVGLLHILWGRLRRQDPLFPAPPGSPSSDIELQRDMVAFLCRHYQEKLSLSDIAAAGHVSRSKCCQMFRRFLGQSPVDYLNTYRLKVASQLLRDTTESVTEIAYSCGFHHLSYFSRSFCEAYGCTPGVYRKRNCSE